MERPYVVCSILIKNEADKYLLRTLNNMRLLTDNFFILDNASNDNSVEICKQFAKDTDAKITVVIDDTNFKVNERHLRVRQFEKTVKLNPMWYLAVDADEIFDEYSINEIRYFINRYWSNGLKDGEKWPLVCMRFSWPQCWSSEDLIRIDKLWRPWNVLREVLFRYEPHIKYRYRKKMFGCGAVPVSIFEDRFYHIVDRPDIILKHLSYAKQKNIDKKYEWYTRQDPNGQWHNRAHLESIGDKNPQLIPYEEFVRHVRGCEKCTNGIIIDPTGENLA